MAIRPQHIVRLTSAPTEMEAGILVAALEQDGIQATMAGQTTSGFRAEAPGLVHVLIAKEDVPRAQDLLHELQHARGEIDWSQVDYGQPEDHEEATQEEAETEYKELRPTGLGFWRRVVQAAVLVGIILILIRLLRGLIL